MTIFERIHLEESKLRAIEKECEISALSLVGKDVKYKKDGTTYTVVKDSVNKDNVRVIVIENNTGTKTFHFSRNITNGLSFENDKEIVESYYNSLDKTEDIAKQKVKIEKLQMRAAEMESILKYLKERGVENLIHFTPTANLESISKTGVLPISEQQKQHIESVTTDHNRYDGKTHSNFSISFPNSAMLFNKVNKDGLNISILKIDVDVLLEETLFDKIYFTEHNATCADVCQKNGVEAVKRMFSDELVYDGRRIKRHPLIPTNNTTDYQAEVLIRGTIPTEYIREIDVQPGNTFGYEVAKRTFPKLTVNYNRELFSDRIDQYNWIKEKNNGYKTGIFDFTNPTIFCA